MAMQFIRVGAPTTTEAKYYIDETVNITKNLEYFRRVNHPYEISAYDGDEEIYLTVIPRRKLRYMVVQIALKAFVASLRARALRRNNADLLNQLYDYAKMMGLVIEVMKDEDAMLAII